MAYPPDFLKRVDQFIALANQMAEGGLQGEVSAAILFAAGRYNAFNFLSNEGSEQDQAITMLKRRLIFMFRSTARPLCPTWRAQLVHW